MSERVQSFLEQMILLNGPISAGKALEVYYSIFADVDPFRDREEAILSMFITKWYETNRDREVSYGMFVREYAEYYAKVNENR
ncbi:hypothetical protein TVAG_167690 [Trichomonas vaginalis G3]|uniref:Uncharacterized protein n=1 Tax=Trichomonas vaginalis (strain ATCC PRA-98 / G3) TaxID=412133 RepID=A2G2J8_TRIV3|nr:hypothetical protein TVAGG3_0918900 [Trichomonas vaginalis G3]EAX88622.1 hypothetical protein TVAG_167690 [Trichomonas vaginalis G3]KAI5485007.1 hypothetical protein TVAGG3_0918900 [Trichomonas vaginalis G3]|eukprot:XP_001301552.1 hypothetical protein [Trichomonas vaginalis G3]